MRPRRIPGLLAGVAVGVPAVLIVRPDWTLYGLIAGGLLAVKIVASLAHPAPRRWRDCSASYRRSLGGRRVVAIVPYFNEDPKALADAVASIAHQSLAPAAVVLVDDGSTVSVESPQLDAACRELADREIDVVRIRRGHNLGKRDSLAEGILHPVARDADVVTLVDSDTTLHRDAIANGLVALVSDRRAAAVTGLVRARNWRTNVLTRLQDVRYAQAFLTDRAAYSVVGSVLCVCGSFTVWRGPVVRSLLDDFVSQRFLGRRATYGDDRHLTNLALRARYRVRFAPTAIAETLVPERVGHFVRQQVRWSKSFLRESMWAITRMPFGPALVLSFFELFSWWALSILLAMALYAGVLHVGVFGGVILLWLVFTSLFRSVRYFDTPRRDQTFVERLGVFVLSPVYGLIHLAVVLPIRFWAFATLLDTRWGSRSRVEVRAA